MANKKKTILMGEGAPESKKDTDKPFSYYLRPRKGGIGGTIGEFPDGEDKSIKIKWRAGNVKGSPAPGYKKGQGSRLRKKSRYGFQIEVKF